MPKVDLEKERKRLDREITFFHISKAERIIKKCLKLSRRNKDTFFLYYFTGQSYIVKEEFTKALLYLEKALRLHTHDGCAYNDKALCLAELGKYEESLHCFNEGLKKDNNCASLFHNKGWLLHLLGRYREAILCFHKALELEPKRAESLYSMADSYVRLGKPEEGRRYFRKALKEIKGYSRYMCRETQKRLKELESTAKFPQRDF